MLNRQPRGTSVAHKHKRLRGAPAGQTRVEVSFTQGGNGLRARCSRNPCQNGKPWQRSDRRYASQGSRLDSGFPAGGFRVRLVILASCSLPFSSRMKILSFSTAN